MNTVKVNIDFPNVEYARQFMTWFDDVGSTSYFDAVNSGRSVCNKLWFNFDIFQIAATNKVEGEEE